MVQQLGRTHRSDQSSAPEYRLLVALEIAGEIRLVTAVAHRLQSLGSVTQVVACTSKLLGGAFY